MKVTLLGIKPVEFTDDKGVLHKGQSAFVEYKDSNVHGMAVEKIWLSGDLMLSVMPTFPASVEIEYFRNRLIEFKIIK